MKAGFIIAMICIMISCKNDVELKQKILQYQTKTVNVETATDVKINYTDSGYIKAKIAAPLMEHYPKKNNPYIEMKKGISADFYTKTGKKESSLTANYAISYELTKIMEVRNNVKVMNVNGDLLETEKLVWNQKTEMITTDKFVKIIKGNDIYFGNGLESNQTFTKYKIKELTGTATVK